MSDEDDGAEKSFAASPERIRQARAKGNVPQSPELLTFARYTGFLIGAVGLAGFLAQSAGVRLTGFFMNPLGTTSLLFNGGKVSEIFSPVSFFFIGMISIGMVLAVVVLIAQQAIVFAPTKLKPELKKINPIKNAGNKFGPAALLDFLKSLVKVTIISTVGFVVAMQALPDMLASVGAPPSMLAGELQSLLVKMLIAAVLVAVLASAIDVPLKWSQHSKKLMMSRQELVKEAKELDGDPEQKRARQAQARAITENRQLQDIPMADVIVVNPEHYAIALQWKRDGSEVPRCIAKGVDHLAARIRVKATAAGVPIYRDVATARSLYATVDVGEEVQREHYEAVAAAIRFADSLKKRS